ncbi:MAG: hypothetical protein IK093_02155 [Ruminiclostridium sp.]|nr:hypothetical protein [Ruminiclostridium sp.]
MSSNDIPITTACPLFVCGICHTKTGHPHQKWCSFSGVTAPECKDCIYWNRPAESCTHPYTKKCGEPI